MEPEARTRFSSIELRLITGTTLRQLQYWSGDGILSPLMKGYHQKRWFDREDMVRAMVARQMRDRHFATRTIRNLLRQAGPAILEALAGEPWILLVTFYRNGDRRRSAEAVKRDQVIAWMKKADATGCFAIALDELATHVHQGIAWLRSAEGRRAARRRSGGRDSAGPVFRSPAKAPGNPDSRASDSRG